MQQRDPFTPEAQRPSLDVLLFRMQERLGTRKHLPGTATNLIGSMNKETTITIPGLAKLLRQQEEAVANQENPLFIEQIDNEIWALRNKYACGSVWGKDPVFDKWWIKQVAKSRNLNIIRQIFVWIAVGAVAIFFIIERNHEIADYEHGAYPAEGYEPDPPTIFGN